MRRFFGTIYLHCWRGPLWRRLNKHNKTNIIHDFDFKKVKVGNYTYGNLDIDELYSDSYVEIGSYCSIGKNVKFICGNHNYKRFSTYPFMSILGNKNFYDKEHIAKPIIVGNDVRIGTGVYIMSGVHIGQGSVVGAGAVVTRDIPPYAIVGGVPAKVIKYRFPEYKIKELLQIDYSNIPIEIFRENYAEYLKLNFDVECIKRLQ